MDREQALKEVKKRVKNPSLLKHMYAVEAVMRRLAKRLGGNEEQWALAGLLHDIDYEETAQDPAGTVWRARKSWPAWAWMRR